jgi:hypothetical protein
VLVNPEFETLAVRGAVTMRGSGAVQIPSGTTAQRPASPTAGMTRFNTDIGLMEYYSGTQWYGVQREPLQVEYLIVGGGGGGGGNFSFAGGGGGAGGFRTNVGGVTLTADIGASYTVLVGAGGAAPASQGNAGLNGADSSFAGVVSSGGGGGGRGDGFIENTAKDGGSGGGAGGATSALVGRGNMPTQSPSQGNNGGTYAQAASAEAASHTQAAAEVRTDSRQDKQHSTEALAE